VIDLDLVMEEIAQAKPWADEPGVDGVVMSTLETAEDLVAELRAARPMRELLIHIATDEILTDFQIERARQLIAAYEKAVG